MSRIAVVFVARAETGRRLAINEVTRAGEQWHGRMSVSFLPLRRERVGLRPPATRGPANRGSLPSSSSAPQRGVLIDAHCYSSAIVTGSFRLLTAAVAALLAASCGGSTQEVATPTATAEVVATAVPAATPTSEPTTAPTRAPEPTAAPTRAPAPTAAPTPAPEPIATSTPIPQAAATPAPAPDPTPESTATAVPTQTIASEADDSIVGRWEGAIQWPREPIEFVVEFTTSAEGLDGSLTFPHFDEVITLANVSFDSPGVHFEIASGGRVIVAYDGELVGDTISGEAMETGESARFTLRRVGAGEIRVEAPREDVVSEPTAPPAALPSPTPPPPTVDCSGSTPTRTAPADAGPLPSSILAPIGINLEYVRYWTPSTPFVNVFRQAENWMSRGAEDYATYDSFVNIPVDAQGYPLEIPYDNGVDPPQVAHTVMIWATNWDYPTGTYTFIFDGDGTVEVLGDVPDHIFEGGGICHQFTVSMPTPDFGLGLVIRRSNKDNPVRNIRLIPLGFESVYEVQPLHPTYLERLNGFSVIRFMDWNETNNNEIERWDERTVPDGALQSRPLKGVAYEYMIQLANERDSDPWFTVPHRVDDSYVAELARLINRELDPERKVYIEYSNEVWNSSFDQWDWANEQGAALGLSDEYGMAGFRYTAKRSAEIFKIFEDEFGAGKERLVKVLATQASVPWVSEQILESFS